MALLGTSEPCKGYTASWSATGTECCAAGAGRATSHGMYSNRSKRGSHLCGQSCFFLIRSCRLSLCCEPSFEERSAGNLHATICGSRGWVTTPGDPVGGAVRRPPIPIQFETTMLSAAGCGSQRPGVTSSRIAPPAFWRPSWHKHCLHRLLRRLLVNLCRAKYVE